MAVNLDLRAPAFDNATWSTWAKRRQLSDDLLGRFDLDWLSVKPLRDGRHFTLRWVLLHLIEETAPHNGHADLVREAIDGVVGE